MYRLGSLLGSLSTNGSSMGCRRLIFSHLGKIALPQALAEKGRERLYFPDAQNFRQGKIYCCGISLYTQGVCYLFEEILIKHKICAFHVYSVLNSVKLALLIP